MYFPFLAMSEEFQSNLDTQSINSSPEQEKQGLTMEKYWLRRALIFSVSRSCSSVTPTDPVGSLLAESKSSGIKKVLEQRVGSLCQAVAPSLPASSQQPTWYGWKEEEIPQPRIQQEEPNNPMDLVRRVPVGLEGTQSLPAHLCLQELLLYYFYIPISIRAKSV